MDRLTERMSAERLKEIGERCENATPGPWRWDRGNSVALCEDGILRPDGNSVFVNSGRGSGDPLPEDSDFICHARTDIPDLLAEVAQLQSERDELQRQRDFEWERRKHFETLWQQSESRDAALREALDMIAYADTHVTAEELRQTAIDALSSPAPSLAHKDEWRDVSAGILMIEDGRILLAQIGPDDKNAPGKWYFPGGKREAGETLSQTVRRELWEELGIRTSNEQLICEGQAWFPGAKFIKYFHLIKTWEGLPKIQPGSGLADIRWVTIESAMKYDLVPAERDAIKAIGSLAHIKAEAHKYTEHPTYTGGGCARCDQPEESSRHSVEKGERG